MNKIRVVELFAGVGGFRLGLEGWNNKSALSGYTEKKNSPYEVIWSNQWEPSTKMQHASMIYIKRWGAENHSNKDIEQVSADQIPNHDLLVGGFPCQDYSVTTTLKNSKGLIGKKGVLWWSIYRILNEKDEKPKVLFLENVDRLLISPASQRGKDFAVILQSLNQLGYFVEWRVINAAEYGMPQKRKRTFILGYHKSSLLGQELYSYKHVDWVLDKGVFAKSFKCSPHLKFSPLSFQLKGSLRSITKKFNKSATYRNPFGNAGVMTNGAVYATRVIPQYKGPYTTLGDVLVKDVTSISKEFIIDTDDLPKWIYLKGSKKEIRTNTKGFKYKYCEGSMSFPDQLTSPSRTIITGEGGPSASRFKHVVYQEPLGYRRLLPIELEKLNMFPENHTKMKTISNNKRAFFMGNALVVGIIEKVAEELKKRIGFSIDSL